MAYNPTVYANDNPPSLNASNLNKSENELVFLDNENSNTKQSLIQIDAQSVEGYTKGSGEVSGTYYENTYMGKEGNTITLSNYTLLEVVCLPNTTYLLTGQGAPFGYIVKDSNSNVIDYKNTGSGTNFSNLEYTTPAGAAKLFVNRGSGNKPIVKQKYGASYVMSEDVKNDLLAAEYSMGIDIEGYEKAKESIQGTLHLGVLFNGGGYSQVEGWSCKEFDVKPNTKYVMTGTGNPMFCVFDENGNRIDWYRPGSNVDVSDYVYRTGSSAKKIYLNRRINQPIATEYPDYKFVKADYAMGKEIGENIYEVGMTGFRQRIGLFSSQNGAFNFDEMKFNDTTFKTVSDDIAPIYLKDATYVGANHGYNFGYTCTATAHGLTSADIGKTYNDGSNTWILLKVLSEDSFMLGCYDSSKWYKLKTATVPGTVNFGTDISVSASSRVQIRPSIKNVSVEVIENDESSFKVSEIYEIIDIGVGIENLMLNQGNNDNDSLVNLSDSLIRESTIYDFNSAGCTSLYKNIEVLKDRVAELQYAYGTQVQTFATTDLFAVLDTTIPELQSAVLSVAKSIWNDENKAPFVYIKTTADKSKGFVVVYIKDRTAYMGSNAGEVNGTSKKLYPRMVNVYSSGARIYGNIILRMPLVKNANGADYVSWAKVGDAVYIFIGNLTAKTVYISTPNEIYGKTVSIVTSNNFTLMTEDVISDIKCATTGEGYALLKIQ